MGCYVHHCSPCLWTLQLTIVATFDVLPDYAMALLFTVYRICPVGIAVDSITITC